MSESKSNICAVNMEFSVYQFNINYRVIWLLVPDENPYYPLRNVIFLKSYITFTCHYYLTWVAMSLAMASVCNHYSRFFPSSCQSQYVPKDPDKLGGSHTDPKYPYSKNPQ